MSHGKVARKRYSGMDHCGGLASLDHCRTIGHQNRRPADRKDVSSTMCQVCDDMARSNSIGICQAITAAAPASQQNAELLRKHPSNGGILLPNSRLRRITEFGSPHCTGRIWAPNK